MATGRTATKSKIMPHTTVEKRKILHDERLLMISVLVKY